MPYNARKKHLRQVFTSKSSLFQSNILISQATACRSYLLGGFYILLSAIFQIICSQIYFPEHANVIFLKVL